MKLPRAARCQPLADTVARVARSSGLKLFRVARGPVLAFGVSYSGASIRFKGASATAAAGQARPSGVVGKAAGSASRSTLLAQRQDQSASTAAARTAAGTRARSAVGVARAAPAGHVISIFAQRALGHAARVGTIPNKARGARCAFGRGQAGACTTAGVARQADRRGELGTDPN